MYLIQVLPIGVTPAMFCWLAPRAGVGRKWSVLACSLIALVGAANSMNIALPTVSAKGFVSFGFGITEHPSIFQIVKFSVPLAICAWPSGGKRSGGTRCWRKRDVRSI